MSSSSSLKDLKQKLFFTGGLIIMEKNIRIYWSRHLYFVFYLNMKVLEWYYLRQRGKLTKKEYDDGVEQIKDKQKEAIAKFREPK